MNQDTKQNDLEESVFYSYFGTLESIEKEIFKLFFEKTIEIIEKDPNYLAYDMKGKMLSFYFTFFEMLSANRSYVLLTLNEHKNQLVNLMQLSSLRTEFKKYVSEIITDEERVKIEKLQEIQEKSITETSWIQMLSILKFWMEDASTAFEKTDIYIEKLLKFSFDIINIKPLESLIDFGKFLFKEKTNKN